MKSHIRRQYTNRQKQMAAELCDQVIHDAIVNAQWLMCIAMNDALGIGAKRMKRMFERYETLTEEYKEAQADDVADELLRRRVVQMGLKPEGGERNG